MSPPVFRETLARLLAKEIRIIGSVFRCSSSWDWLSGCSVADLRNSSLISKRAACSLPAG
jgi:hypothetical protein